MNILHICTSSGFSGREQYALAVAKGQRDLGHNVYMATAPRSNLDEYCRHDGVKTVNCRPSSLWSRVLLARTILKLMTQGLDTIHLHGTRDVGLVFLIPFLAKLSGMPKPKTIMQTHLWIDHRKRDLWHWLLYRAVDEVWCSSRNAQENLRRILPVPASNIRVVNYGLDVEAIENSYLPRLEARRQLNLPLDKKLIVCVSRLDRQKGILELLRAATPILSNHSDVGVVIVGGPTVNEQESIEYQNELLSYQNLLPVGVRERIYFVGARPKSFRFLKAFDMFVLPSYKECFSLALLEAQLAGLPVLGTASGGTPEAIRENITGWLCPARDIPAMTTALQSALKQHNSWSAMGTCGGGWVKAHFDFAVIQQNILSMYSTRTIENHKSLVASSA